MKIPIAIIIDNCSLESWQQESINFISQYVDIRLVLNCQNTHNKKNLFKHFIYYLINFFSLKNRSTAKVKFINDNDIQCLSFNSIYKGSWQSIPHDISKVIASKEIKLVLKFGMSLLTIDKSLEQFDILSFHHGDPEFYRGRPAGFYEILNDADKTGIVVQKLSNELDAGVVFARGYSQICNYSYKKTSINFFNNSKYILKHAILNYSSSQVIYQEKLGKNYTLPSNYIALVFIFKILKKKFNKVIYGIFYEKKWNIAKFSNINPVIRPNLTLDISDAKVPNIKEGYTFYADPFFSSSGSMIRLEALNKSSGLGEIIEIDSTNLEYQRSIFDGDHFSYPFSIEHNEKSYLLPEISSHSHQMIFPEPFEWTSGIKLKGLEDFRIVDATLLRHEKKFYLFASFAESSMDCLQLFFSDELLGTYHAHPKNPIVIDPSCARMGGRIQFVDGKLYRYGQNNSYGYGQSLTVSIIEELSAVAYREEKVSNVTFKNSFGPHTIDSFNNNFIFDFYRESFHFLAGYRRFLARLKKYL